MKKKIVLTNWKNFEIIEVKNYKQKKWKNKNENKEKELHDLPEISLDEED